MQVNRSTLLQLHVTIELNARVGPPKPGGEAVPVARTSAVPPTKVSSGKSVTRDRATEQGIVAMAVRAPRMEPLPILLGVETAMGCRAGSRERECIAVTSGEPGFADPD